ncbi:MAG TPA: hypothetical protein HA224_03090 [Nanoarchaeota archaeon]|nr:hypothetical protein [Nanoarchaeota archaeon]
MKKLCLIPLMLILLALFSGVASAGINAPDLVVRKVIVYPTAANIIYAPADGTFVKIGFTFIVTNLGATVAPKSDAEVKLVLPDGSVQGHGVFGTKALALFQSELWRVNNPPPLAMTLAISSKMAGINTLVVCADVLNQAQESREGNNCAKLRFNVKIK